jgi:hypothetical protein
VQAILRKFGVKAQKHDKMDGAEKLLSISQCQTTVAKKKKLYTLQFNSIQLSVYMIGIFSGTDMIKKVPICLIEVLICLGIPKRPGADLSCCRIDMIT